MKAVRIKHKPILLARVGGEVFGASNVCPHAGCELQGGILTGYIVMCPCHGWKFDVRNGQYQDNPLNKLESYPCGLKTGKYKLTSESKNFANSSVFRGKLVQIVSFFNLSLYN